MSEAARIDIVTPAKWKAQGFWHWRRKRTFGLVLAFAPSVFALGIELISGSSRGVALMIGPLWIGFATLKVEQHA